MDNGSYLKNIGAGLTSDGESQNLSLRVGMSSIESHRDLKNQGLKFSPSNPIIQDSTMIVDLSKLKEGGTGFQALCDDSIQEINRNIQ